MKKKVLVTLADRRFLDQAKQLFASAYLAGGWDGDYLLLAHDLLDEETRPFRERGILVENRPPLVFGKKESVGQGQNTWSGVVWSKLYLFDQSFKRWEQVVFLDSDIIVRDSLEFLVGKKGLWAGTDDFYPALSNRFLEEDQEAVKLLEENYQGLHGASFNSGVLAYHTDLIKEDSFGKLKELAEKYHNVSYSDEAVLNLFFLNQWQVLPLTYNLLVPYWLKYCRLRPEQMKGTIWHFVGREERAKPWSRVNPFYEIWRTNLEHFAMIDFASSPHRPESSLPTTPTDYCRFLNRRRLIYFHPRLDRQIGLWGLKLKKVEPRIYFKLKKIKDVLPFFGYRAGA